MLFFGFGLSFPMELLAYLSDSLGLLSVFHFSHYILFTFRLPPCLSACRNPNACALSSLLPVKDKNVLCTVL
jgi:hypothetical protein